MSFCRAFTLALALAAQAAWAGSDTYSGYLNADAQKLYEQIVDRCKGVTEKYAYATCLRNEAKKESIVSDMEKFYTQAIEKTMLRSRGKLIEETFTYKDGGKSVVGGPCGTTAKNTADFIACLRLSLESNKAHVSEWEKKEYDIAKKKLDDAIARVMIADRLAKKCVDNFGSKDGVCFLYDSENSAMTKHWATFKYIPTSDSPYFEGNAVRAALKQSATEWTKDVPNAIKFSCPDTVRLDKKVALPVYDQRRIGSCYAASSALVLDYYRKTAGKNDSSDDGLYASPIHLAALFKSIPGHQENTKEDWGRIPTDLGGGDSNILLGSLVHTRPEGNVCTRKGVDKVFKDYMKKEYGDAIAAKLSTEDFLLYLQRLYGNYWYYSKDPAKRDAEMEKVRKDFSIGNIDGKDGVVNPDTCLTNYPSLAEQPSIANLNEKFAKIKSSLNPFNDGQAGMMKFVLHLIEENCPKSDRVSSVGPYPKPLYAVEKPDGSKRDIGAFLDHQLCSAEQPVSISVCASGWLTGGTDDKKVTCSLQCTEGDKVKKRTCRKVDHEVAVMGRRNVNGKTEYLVQNSWGANHCKNSDITGVNGCEPTGTYWIAQDQLISRSTEVVGFTPPKAK